MSSAFQANAFQASAFQTTSEVVETVVANPFQGAGYVVYNRKKLLELYEAWRGAKKKAEELKPGKAKNALVKAIKAAEDVLDAPVDELAVTALTNALDAAASASRLSQIVIEARTAIAEAQAIQAQIDDDEEAYLLLVA